MTAMAFSRPSSTDPLHTWDCAHSKRHLEAPRLSICERVIGALRLECLDFVIPLKENHLRLVMKKWITHYNRGRSQPSLGPGNPDPQVELSVPQNKNRHRIPSHCKVIAHPILGGLHHEYRLVTKAAWFLADGRSSNEFRARMPGASARNTRNETRVRFRYRPRVSW